MYVNNLPSVVALQQHDRDSNTQPVDCKSDTAHIA